VVLNINPAVQIVDICNSVYSFDLLDGALTIAQAYLYFPADSIHVVVVDPGVGTARRPILAYTGKHSFIAPDNGVLSFVYDREERIVVRHIDAPHYFLQPVSNTFHGRDIFASVAGWLSKGVQYERFGEEITDYVRFAVPRPKAINERMIKGVVLKVDKFGNLVTNISPRELPQLFQPDPPPFKITVGKMEVVSLKTAYGQGAPGEVFAIPGSMGFLEIACNRGAASRLAGADRGSEVGVLIEAPTAVKS
jgi:S-adenosylmethionine hydrolase